MIKLVYDIGIFFYHIFLYLASFFHTKAKLFIKGRKNWKQYLNEKKFKNCSWVWFHCCSLGEFEDGKTFICEFKIKYPLHKILITFSSPSGFEIRKNTELADHVMYLPLDYSFNARYFINSINIKTIFFVRNEIWFNYLRFAKIKQIPLFHLSTFLNKKSNFFKWPLNRFFKDCFGYFDCLFVQNAETKNLLSLKLKTEKSLIVGNTRIDSVNNNKDELVELFDVENFVDKNMCVIGGSLLARDISLFLIAFEKLKSKNYKWILVPHEIDRDLLNEIVKNNIEETILYSNIRSLNKKHQILIIDCVGILPFLYRYSHISYIGGGFNRIGIHNILEPCVFGNTLLVGPNTRSYIEANDLIENKVCFIIKNENDLTQKIEEFTSNTELLNVNKLTGENYIRDNSGAVSRSLKYYALYLK